MLPMHTDPTFRFAIPLRGDVQSRYLDYVMPKMGFGPNKVMESMDHMGSSEAPVESHWKQLGS